MQVRPLKASLAEAKRKEEQKATSQGHGGNCTAGCLITKLKTLVEAQVGRSPCFSLRERQTQAITGCTTVQRLRVSVKAAITITSCLREISLSDETIPASTSFR